MQPWEQFEKIIDKVDLFLFDIKHMNNEKHLKYTGVSNRCYFRKSKKAFGKRIAIFI